MHTISKDFQGVGAGRRRRRVHSAEFKAQVVVACSAPGVSVAAVAGGFQAWNKLQAPAAAATRAVAG